MDLIAGLDLGTTSAKLTLLTPDGAVVGRQEHPYPTRTAPGGIAEQTPEDWWRATAEVFAASGLAGRVAAVGLTGQMQDLIAVRSGAALHPALLYFDVRATAQHARLSAEIPAWEHRTGNHQEASGVAPKIAWLAEHHPQVVAEAEHFLLGAPGHIAYLMTGVAACDLTTASTTGLLDATARGWFADAIEAAGGHVTQLPRLVGESPGDEVIGTVTSAAAEALGLRPGTPVVHALGDAGATTHGLVGIDPGDAYLYLGTSGWLAAVTAAAEPEPSPIHSLVLPGWVSRLRIGAIQSAGAASAWARRTFFPDDDFARVEELIAARVTDLTNRPLCLPGLGGERTPVRNNSLRGAFIGVQEASDATDLYLGVLTGVAMGLRHAADQMGIAQERIALVGGAAGSAAWRQILADVFGATIVTGAAVEPAAHSAARTAADAVGLPHALGPLLGAGGSVTETTPSAVHERYLGLLATHRSLYDALTPTFQNLAPMP